jgi:hypothetical protein
MPELLDAIRAAEIIVGDVGEGHIPFYGRAAVQRFQSRQAAGEGDGCVEGEVRALAVPINLRTDDYEQLAGLVRAERGTCDVDKRDIETYP